VTNATKALIIAAVNPVLAVITNAGVDMSDGLQTAIYGVVNAGLALAVGLTYKRSAKRIPDGPNG
jgi:hypothetical protein